MAGIPICEQELDPNDQFREQFRRMEVDVHDRAAYYNLMRELTDLVGDDCWAVTYNDEVLYNAFVPPALARDRILQDILRDSVTKDMNAHLIHDAVLHEATVRMYMYYANSTEVTIRCTHDLIRVELREQSVQPGGNQANQD